MKNVLVIEDDKNISDLVQIHLKDLGCIVTNAFDGETGLSNALNGTYDLIVLDLMLPKIDGLEICRQIRSKKYTPY
jgi:two-component system response regulator ArlR